MQAEPLLLSVSLEKLCPIGQQAAVIARYKVTFIWEALVEIEYNIVHGWQDEVT